MGWLYGCVRASDSLKSTLKTSVVYPVWIMPQFGLFREYEQRVKWINHWSWGSQESFGSTWTSKTGPRLDFFPHVPPGPTTPPLPSCPHIHSPYRPALLLTAYPEVLLSLGYLQETSIFHSKSFLTSNLENPIGINLLLQMGENKCLSSLHVSEEYFGRIKTHTEGLPRHPSG